MPELPEVETIRRQLEKEIVGCTIADVWYDREKMLRPSVEEFVKGVRGKKIAGVSRRAKLLIFVVAGLVPARGDHKGRNYITCHLRLSGRLFVRQEGNKPDDYAHVILRFEGGRELRFSEMRLFGYMEYLPDQASLERILSKYGPEPLDDLTADKFYSILQKTKKPIKPVLLDQSKLSGVGNIYANDALFLAKIHPQTPAKSLNRRQSDNLLEAIEQVLKEGLKYGGASDQWYLQVHGERGSYQDHFKVYGRTGQDCIVCGTKIERVALGGRGTFYCPKCQK